MKPTRQERALAACIEYDTLMERIKDLTQSIGNAINQCPKANDPNAVPDARGHYPTHLNKALSPYTEQDYFDNPRRYWLDDNEKREILDQCSHCSMAYEFIQKRRAARKRLGIIKRTIRSIGRSTSHD